MESKILVSPSAKPARLYVGEDETDELSERCCIHRFDPELAAVTQVLVVDEAAWQARSFDGFVVLVDELHLKSRNARISLLETSSYEKVKNCIKNV